MKGPTYAPLDKAHVRIQTQLDSRKAAREVGDRQLERRDAAQTTAQCASEAKHKISARAVNDPPTADNLWNRLSLRVGSSFKRGGGCSPCSERPATCAGTPYARRIANDDRYAFAGRFRDEDGVAEAA